MVGVKWETAMPKSELPFGWILLCVFVYVSLERWGLMITFHLILLHEHRAPAKAKRTILIGLKTSG